MIFADLGLAQPLLRAVEDEGYTTPTPIQEQAIPHVAEGRDLLGCAQTGTGKTAAFALPIMHRLIQAGPPPHGRFNRKIRVLILSPTRELAVQIGDSFRAYGRHTKLRHTLVYGGVSQRPQVRDLQHGVDTLIATPGRLVDLMNQGFVDLSTVEIFVLDEADRMLDMGFMPDLKRVIAKLPRQRQTLFFSATMPGEIAELAYAILKNPIEVTIAPVKVTTELVEQSLYHVARNQKTDLLAGLIDARGIHKAIVFTRTKHGADRVTEQLNKRGIKAEAIHGNKSQNARQRTLGSFKQGRVQVLVATDLAARGIDVDGVSYVFNYDLPHEPETYIHRIGRTGRAGATGIAVAFCDFEERKFLAAIEKLTGKRVPVETELPAGVQVTLLAAREAPRSFDKAPIGRSRRPHFANSGGRSQSRSAGRGFTAGKSKRRPSTSRW